MSVPARPEPGRNAAARVCCGWCAALVAILAGANAPAAEGPKIDFERQVRPILSQNCFACHGPDGKARKAGLRLDVKDEALRARDGGAAIVPGDPENSNLVVRIESDDPEAIMPPPKSGHALKREQVALLKTWVEQGAPWSEHWAFRAPSRPAPPEIKDGAWPRNPIDRFILARLEAEGLAPTAEADRTALIRRVTLDLTGLPPTPAEVDAFLNDTSADAYEKVVDRLLRSPRYGEHMARFWLDAARYGDTHGLHLDNYREFWPYRDWVIGAYNANTPFDRFITEQLAGDLLPDATLAQRVASGFNRAHVTTSEGGSIAEEVYVRNVVDRVETTGVVFLGLTIGCARCHDHKYDPITMKDFYSLFAVFNSLDDNPLDGNAANYPPSVKVPNAEQAAALADLDARLAAQKAKLAAAVAAVALDESADANVPRFVQRADFTWIDDALPANAQPSVNGAQNVAWAFGGLPDQPVRAGKSSVRLAAEGLQQVVFEKASPELVVGEGDRLFAHVFIDPTRPPKELMLQWHTDGWKHRAYWGENAIDFGKDGTPERFKAGPLPRTGTWARLEVDAAAVGLKPGTKINGLALTQHGGNAWWDEVGIETWTPQPGKLYQSFAEWDRDQRATKGAALPKDLQEIAKLEPSKRDAAQAKRLRDHFIESAYAPARPTLEPIRAEVARLAAERKKVDDAIPTTLISQERPEPKPAFLLDRGEYDRPRDKVERAVPGFLPPLPEGSKPDRLGFARWLVAPEHPLTARVAANRLWQQFFGVGLVKTAEDFGSQGEPPSHPELLDWLAVDFREGGWDVKRFAKQIVMSATYRQASRATADRLAKDPANRLLSRGPRFRLDAEMLRDQALFVGNLLVEHVGGPSVKPPQPAGLWEAVGYTSSNTAKFAADTGREKVHRRSLYTFWKRTSPPPQMTAFDAPSREACFVRRERTNTPLQALLLMNEPQYVEASRALGERALHEGGSNPQERLEYLFRLVVSRPPDAVERAELLSAFEALRDTYARDPEAARKLITIGETRPDDRLDPSELAAWTMVGNLLLNLDEVISKG